MAAAHYPYCCQTSWSCCKSYPSNLHFHYQLTSPVENINHWLEIIDCFVGIAIEPLRSNREDYKEALHSNLYLKLITFNIHFDITMPLDSNARPILNHRYWTMPLLTCGSWGNHYVTIRLQIKREATTVGNLFVKDQTYLNWNLLHLHRFLVAC